jgi:hypothetical protein
MQGAFLFGAAALVFGLIPSYAAGYFVHLKLEPWNGRFAMGSMPGVALLGAIFIEYVISAPRKRLFAIALILSLGIGWQIRMTNVFRWAWDAETNFYHQLLLRAPQIAPHTAFLAESEFLGRMGDYPTSFALNSIYATPGDVNSKEVRTWLFLINSNFSGHIDGLLSTIPLEATKSSSHFIGKSSDSLVIYFEPDLGQCLWIITPENSDMPIVPKILRTVSPLTNLSLIQQSDSPPPFYQLLAAPQPDDWCSFYQRGSLAHQFGEWDKAAAQWQQAADKGLRPANGFEYLPFIDSYARLGKWAQALELTKNSNKASKGMANTLCSTWRRLEQQTTTSPGREATLNQALDILQCN